MVDNLAVDAYVRRTLGPVDRVLKKLEDDGRRETAEQWETLRRLRAKGKRPTFPVYLTSHPRFARNLTEVGALVISHYPGTPMPVELLDGLDVCLHFLNCDMGGRVKRLMDEKGVKPNSLKVWCNCGETYTVSCGPCDDGSEPWAT